MKICFFHLKAYAAFNATSDAPIGGTLVQMRIVAEKLSENPSFSVSFLTGDFGQQDAQRYKNIIVYKSAKLKRHFWYYAIALFKIWNGLRNVNADIYIASSAGMETGLLALFCKLYKKKMVYRTAHEWDCNGEYGRSHGFAGASFEYGLKNAYCIIAQADEHRDLLLAHYGLHSTVIKNSFFIEHDNIANKKDVLWVSRCEKWKNPEIFIWLAEQFPEQSFTMICPKQKYQEAYYEEIRVLAGRQGNIRFIDFIPFEHIQDYFNRALVFVGTSEYEGFPNTFLQACMGHTAILSYKVNPDNFISKNDVGYVASGDEKQLYLSLKKLLSNEGERSKKSDNAFIYVEKNHDINKNIHAWIETISA